MRSNETIVDSRFFIPQNIVDVRYRQDYDVTDSFGDIDYTNQTPIDTVQPGDSSGTTVSLPTPNINFDIVSQTIKTAPDGTQTVDVVIELPEAGATYEVRFTRVV